MKINELFTAITAAIESDESDIKWDCQYDTVLITGFSGLLELRYTVSKSSIEMILLDGVWFSFESHTNIDSFRNMTSAVKSLVDSSIDDSIDRIISTKW